MFMNTHCMDDLYKLLIKVNIILKIHFNYKQWQLGWLDIITVRQISLLSLNIS